MKAQAIGTGGAHEFQAFTKPPARRRLCPDEPERGGILETDTFCWHCGKALIWGSALRCECGHELAKVDRFCTKCGTPVKLLAE